MTQLLHVLNAQPKVDDLTTFFKINIIHTQIVVPDIILFLPIYNWQCRGVAINGWTLTSSPSQSVVGGDLTTGGNSKRVNGAVFHTHTCATPRQTFL